VKNWSFRLVTELDRGDIGRKEGEEGGGDEFVGLWEGEAGGEAVGDFVEDVLDAGPDMAAGCVGDEVGLL
jgi:hypothetical protein